MAIAGRKHALVVQPKFSEDRVGFHQRELFGPAPPQLRRTFETLSAEPDERATTTMSPGLTVSISRAARRTSELPWRRTMM